MFLHIEIKCFNWSQIQTDDVKKIDVEMKIEDETGVMKTGEGQTVALKGQRS